MKNSQKGSAALWVVVILIIIILGIVGYLYFKNTSAQTGQVLVGNSTAAGDDQIVGSKLYQNNTLGINFQYPSNLILSEKMASVGTTQIDQINLYAPKGRIMLAVSLEQATQAQKDINVRNNQAITEKEASFSKIAIAGFDGFKVDTDPMKLNGINATGYILYKELNASSYLMLTVTDVASSTEDLTVLDTILTDKLLPSLSTK